jgi:LPS-assembly protein
MKNKYFFIILCLLLHAINSALADEIIFESKDINILDNGNRIISNQGVAQSLDHGLTIKADNFDYNKNASILVATKDAIATLAEKNLAINADKLIYNKNLSTLDAIGNVKIYNSVNGISIISNKILYDINKNKIESISRSEIKDKLGNLFLSENFIYTLNDNLIKFDDLKFIDVEKNISQINKAFVNVESKKLIGKDISIDFNNKSFNKNNEPRLKGNSVIVESGNTLFTKGVFTTCKKNDDCPPWELSAKEIKHDKKKKTIYYKDAWLKIYDKPVFYFPKFFHPDFTVKRQSGFLMPSFKSSSNIGTSFNLPYYHVISDNKDFTIRPRFYADEKLLIQSEYRQVNSNSNHSIDYSFFNGKNESNKSHLFLNTYKELNFSYFEDSQLDIKLEQVTNDSYLKVYDMKSPIINSSSSLESSIKIEASKENLSLDLDFQIFESLAVDKKSDKYEYILPNYNLIKEFREIDQFSGIFSLNSTGSLTNYNTNVSEKIMINDFYFKSHPKFNGNGIESKYNFLVKNTNTNSENSLKYEKNSNHDVTTLVEYNSTYPLKKITQDYSNIIKPKISLRYSPNNSKNLRNEERRIDTNNIFSLNRVTTNDTIEGGASLTYGTQFLKTDLMGKDLLDMSIANVIRLEENKNISINSSLGKKMSDVFGSINFSPNHILTTGYDFSINNNFVDKNYEIFKGEIKINNFVTEFDYLNENNTLGKSSFLSHKTSYNIDNSNSVSFKTRENKKTKITEFYNLIYQYRNDCLIAAIEYNKDYYTDKNLKPSEDIFLKLTIIPFGQTTSPNLRN